MTEEVFLHHISEYRKKPQHERLGQYLMNRLDSYQNVPDIFYNRNDGDSAAMFYERFVDA